MAKNVMKQLKPSANLGRNAIDLSHRNVFTANFGELLPCCCIETVPSDDYLEIKPADLVRAMPLVTSPFLRAKQHIDFWFVPYSALWSRFNEFMVDKSEPASSAFNERNFLPWLSLTDLYTYAGASSVTDIVGRPLGVGAEKLLNLLGYSCPAGYLQSTRESYNVNLFRLAAYNFIWYKEYRQKYYDDGTFGLSVGESPASLWNFDDVSCASQATAEISYGRTATQMQAMLQMRYRLWKKDLFTGLMPAQQYGNVSTLSADNIQKVLNVVGYSGQVFKNMNGTDPLMSGSGSNVGNLSLAAGTVRTITSVLDLRKAEAVQIWRENALRAGNQIEDNFEAHYGSKPRSHMITHPTYIGSYDSSLNIGDVISTAQTGSGTNQTLGDIAGKGMLSLDGHTIKFKTTDFGIVMGIFSMLPEAEYNALGVDRMNQLLEREDFFIPEYQNLGLEPVSSATFYSGQITGGSLNVLGFAPRYWGYKQKFDQCFGEMMHTAAKTGIYSHWCSPKTDVPAQVAVNGGVLPLACLYVNPALFDINFSVSLAQSEQFLVDIFNNVTAIRGMSISGMPSY